MFGSGSRSERYFTRSTFFAGFRGSQPVGLELDRGCASARRADPSTGTRALANTNANAELAIALAGTDGGNSFDRLWSVNLSTGHRTAADGATTVATRWRRNGESAARRCDGR